MNIFRRRSRKQGFYNVLNITLRLLDWNRMLLEDKFAWIPFETILNSTTKEMDNQDIIKKAAKHRLITDGYISEEFPNWITKEGSKFITTDYYKSEVKEPHWYLKGLALEATKIILTVIIAYIGGIVFTPSQTISKIKGIFQKQQKEQSDYNKSEVPKDTSSGHQLYPHK